MSVLVNQGNELLDCRSFRRWLITVPFEIPALPENSPPTPRSDVCGFCEGLFLLLARSATPHWPDFKELHALARNAKAEIELRPNVGRRPAAFNEATHCLPNSRRFKFAERHREPTPNGEVEGPDDHAGQPPRAQTVLQRPRRVTTGASRTPRTIVRRLSCTPSAQARGSGVHVLNDACRVPKGVSGKLTEQLNGGHGLTTGD